MTGPLVSIITPAYNAAPFLRETWKSVRSQTYQNWEWIVVDDASTDETPAILGEIARVDPRVRLFGLGRNHGHAGKVRNIGLDEARGELVAFLDADDVWRRRKLEAQVKYLDQHPGVDVVCTYIYILGDRERKEQWERMLWRYGTRIVTPGQIIAQSMPTSSILFRRKCYDEQGGMDEDPRLVVGEDTEFGIRLVMHYTAHRIRSPLTGYRVSALGCSLSTADARRNEERALALHHILFAKGLLRGFLRRRHLALTWYNLAKNNLFHHGLPFRRQLFLSIQTLAAPSKAWVMLALCWMPAALLRRTLEMFLSIRQRG